MLVLVSAFLYARRLLGPLRTLSRQPGETGRQAAYDAALAAGIAAVVLAAGTASFVATYFEIFPVDLLFWLFLGVLPSLRPASPTAPSPSAPAAAASRPTAASSSAD